MNYAIQYSRAYFWPVIVANTAVMSHSLHVGYYRGVLLGCSISLLASFGFLLNDLWDRRTDSINRPDHFESTSARGLAVASIAAILFLAAGIFVARMLGTDALYVAVGIAIALTAYSTMFRRFLIAPTLTAACLATAPMWAPAALWSQRLELTTLSFVVGVVLAIAGRETLMDVRDTPGDAATGRDTIATIFGNRVGKITGVALIASSCLLFAYLSVSKTRDMSWPVLFFDLLTLVVIYSLVTPLREILSSSSDNEHLSIVNFVTRSRRVMAVTPLWLFLLLRA